MCVFVVINILHEVSMSFLFYFSVAFNFTTYHIEKKRELQTDINYRTVRVYLHRLFLIQERSYILKIRSNKTKVKRNKR